MSYRIPSTQKCLVSTLLITLAVALLSQCQSLQDSSSVPYEKDVLWPDRVPDGRISFQNNVKPLLEDQCLECHNHVDARNFAGLNLETRHSALNSGRNAPVIVPGDPQNSLLIQVLKLDSKHPVSMPAAQEKIEGVRLAILEKWIQQGADWPENVRLLRPQDKPSVTP
ncbi:MAG: hypothetical protein KDN22_02240 [Verrucomicrobiae bacterium]|nr:hypothetical protein [Verrucomicrobiae bacterium]